MPLRFGLVPNLLTDDPDDHMAVVTDNETVSTEQIVEQMISRGSTVTKAEALSVIEEFSAAVVNSVKNGNNVNTELFKIYPSISGVFANESEAFNSNKHSVKLNLNAGTRLSEIVNEISLQKVDISTPQPTLQQFVDLKSKEINTNYSPGQIASIRGSQLKFDEDDEQQGIFFIAADGTETKVNNIAKNKPSELLFFVPESLSGIQQVEVRAILKNYKSMRSGRLLVDLVLAE